MGYIRAGALPLIDLRIDHLPDGILRVQGGQRSEVDQAMELLQRVVREVLRRLFSQQLGCLFGYLRVRQSGLKAVEAFVILILQLLLIVVMMAVAVVVMFVFVSVHPIVVFDCVNASRCHVRFSSSGSSRKPRSGRRPSG